MSIIYDDTPNNKWYPYDHWYSDPMRWFKITMISLCLLLVLIFGYKIYHHYNYICLRGHYFTSYSKFGKDYVWCCEEEILGSDYNKMMNKPVIPCGCN